MAIRDWQDVAKIVNDSGAEYPAVQLNFLVQRLEALSHHPDTMGVIADAVRDMGEWYSGHADELRDEVSRRNGENVKPFKQGDTA